MKCKADMKDILYALSIVKDTVGGDKGGHAGIRVYASKKNRMKFSSIDGNHATEIWIDASVHTPGIVVVKAAQFINYMMKLNVKEAQFIASKNHGLQVKTTRGSTTFHGYAVDEFPSIPEVSEVGSFHLPGKMFRSMINGVAFSAQKEKEADQGKIQLQGVNLRTNGKVLEVAATNGRVIAHYRKKLSASPIDVTLAKKPLTNAARIAKDDDKVTIKCGNNSVFSVKIRDATYYIPVYAGIFPDIKKTIPSKKESYDAEFVAERAALLETLDRGLAALTSKSGKGIIHFEKGMVMVKGNTEETDFNEGLDTQCEGNAGDVKIDFARLAEVIKHVDSDTIRVGIRDGMPLVIRPQGGTYHTCLLAIG